MPRGEPDRIDRDHVDEARANTFELREARSVVHLPQEIPLEDPQSKRMFQPRSNKPFVSTPAALDTFGAETILICLARIQQKATLHNALDYLQIFEDAHTHTRLWFIEDDEGGAITALLPSDY